MRSINIIVVGVGGQGILTLASILSAGALARGYEVLTAETHGMSQRGGSVIVHVRIGKSVLAPLVPIGGANYIVGLELIEVVRYLHYGNKSTFVIANDKVIPPPLTPEIPKSEELKKIIASKVGKAVFIPASDIALNLGVPQSANMVILGSLTKVLESYIDLETMRKLVSKVGRGKVAQANLRAFEIGYAEISKYVK